MSADNAAHPTTEVLRLHLLILSDLLREGYARGLHAALARQRRRDVERLLATTSPRYSERQTHAAFLAAGPEVVYGAVFHAYVVRVEMLDERAEDTEEAKQWLRDLVAVRLTPRPPVWEAPPAPLAVTPPPPLEEPCLRLLQGGASA